jgi:hypothetical protein
MGGGSASFVGVELAAELVAMGFQAAAGCAKKIK